jgi:hypothetical protein
MGRVESFAAEQYADSAFISAGLRLVQNGALVLDSELAASGRGRDLGIGDGDRPDAAGVQLLEIRLEHEHEFLLRARQ